MIAGIGVLCFVAAICDLCQKRIPNVLIAIGIVYGVVFDVCQGGAGNLLDCFCRLLVMMLLLFPFFMIGALGAGDVKLFMLLPLYFDLGGLRNILVLTFGIAAVQGVVILLLDGKLVQRLLVATDYIHQCVIRRVLLPYPETESRYKVRIAIPMFIGCIVELAYMYAKSKGAI